MARLFLHGRVAIRPRPHRGAVHYVDDRVAILHDRSMDLNPAAGVASDGRQEAEDHARKAMTAAGALVVQLRREAGMSIASLAARADLSPGLLSQIERGQGNPSLTTLIKL